MVASKTTIAIGARRSAKFSGFVLMVGEVRIAKSSVVDPLDIIASGVEIKLAPRVRTQASTAG